MPDYQKELVEYRLQPAPGNYADFFLVSRNDAVEQYEKAEKFIDAVKKYLNDKI